MILDMVQILTMTKSL